MSQCPLKSKSGPNVPAKQANHQGAHEDRNGVEECARFPPALCPNEVRVRRDESVLMLRALAVTPIVGRQNSIALVPGPFPIPVFGRTRADV